MYTVNIIEVDALSNIIDKVNNVKYYLVIDQQVKQLHQSALRPLLNHTNLLGEYIFCANEIDKSIAEAECILKDMLSVNVNRTDVLIAIGGGITTDIGGFVASIYKRGITWYAVPTTLLGMIDAAIGGKTGVNSGDIKNAFGSFHFPNVTFYYYNFLQTLNCHDRVSGFGEYIKYAYISSDIDLNSALFNLKYTLDISEINHCIAYKKSVVLNDPSENNIRQYLNFGHTLGHVIEKIPRNHLIGHGIAVMHGIAFSLYVSAKALGLSIDVYRQYNDWLQQQPFYDSDVYPKTQSELEIVKNDKKNMYQQLVMVLIQSIGKPQIHALGYKEFLEYYEFFKSTYIDI